MKHTFLFTLLIFCPLAFSQNCLGTQSQNEAGLVASEKTWAQSLEKRDRATLECILADGFQDADVEGKTHDRDEVLDRVRTRRDSHNELSEMQPHAFGNIGYVRGLNTVIDPTGKVLAKVRFTDIFIYRDNRWQAVAGQETLLTEDSK